MHSWGKCTRGGREWWWYKGSGAFRGALAQANFNSEGWVGRQQAWGRLLVGAFKGVRYDGLLDTE